MRNSGGQRHILRRHCELFDAGVGASGAIVVWVSGKSGIYNRAATALIGNLVYIVIEDQYGHLYNSRSRTSEEDEMMQLPNVETLVRLAEQLSEDEQTELVRRIEALQPPRQRPSETLHVFQVDAWPEGMTLWREDEYSNDGR